MLPRFLALTAALSVHLAVTAAPAKPPAAPLATREQLNACMDQQEDVRRQHSALGVLLDQHAATAQQFRTDMQTHLASAPDPKNDEAVKAYNARVDELNARSEAIRARSKQLDADQNALVERNEAVNKQCAGLTVRQSDRDAVLKARAAASQP